MNQFYINYESILSFTIYILHHDHFNDTESRFRLDDTGWGWVVSLGF